MNGVVQQRVRHRHYSVDLGRWISRDPAGYVDGWSLYGYVNGRPLVMFDPYGLDGFWSDAWYIAKGFGEGLVDGAAITSNALTGGLISPLDSHVDRLIEANGTAYQVANVSANIGAIATDVVGGVGIAKAGAKAGGKLLAKSADDVVDAGRGTAALVASGSTAVAQAHAVAMAAGAASAGAVVLAGGSADEIMEAFTEGAGCTKTTPPRVSGRNPPIRPRQQLHTNGTPGKSQFNPGLDVESVVRRAWESGTNVFNRNGDFIGKRFTFDSPIGTSPSGHPQSSVFVHWSRNNGIHGVPTTVGQGP